MTFVRPIKCEESRIQENFFISNGFNSVILAEKLRQVNPIRREILCVTQGENFRERSRKI